MTNEQLEEAYNTLEKKYFDLLSMFALVLQSVGGKAEFGYEEAEAFNPHGAEVVQSFDQDTKRVRFEVRKNE